MSKRNIKYLVLGANIDGGLKVEYAKDKYLFKASASLIKDNPGSNKVVKTEVISMEDGGMELINRLNEEMLEESDNKEEKKRIYQFEIEMIDKSRLGGSKSTKFKF